MRFATTMLLAACLAVPASAEVMGIGKKSASATIFDAAGIPVGKAKIVGSKKHGLQVRIEARNLTPGEHGVHIHSIGRCEGPDFKSAGPHANLSNKQHGLDNPEGSHTGDMPNMLVSRKGRGKLSYDIPGGWLTGNDGILDADGAAIVIHAKSDDQRTDPSGNSGDRVACGVLLRD